MMEETPWNKKKGKKKEPWDFEKKKNKKRTFCKAK